MLLYILFVIRVNIVLAQIENILCATVSNIQYTNHLAADIQYSINLYMNKCC